jgi:hypothetical protein
VRIKTNGSFVLLTFLFPSRPVDIHGFHHGVNGLIHEIRDEPRKNNEFIPQRIARLEKAPSPAALFWLCILIAWQVVKAPQSEELQETIRGSQDGGGTPIGF